MDSLQCYSEQISRWYLSAMLYRSLVNLPIHKAFAEFYRKRDLCRYKYLHVFYLIPKSFALVFVEVACVHFTAFLHYCLQRFFHYSFDVKNSYVWLTPFVY